MRTIRRALSSETAAGWAFVLPSFALIVLFGLIPIGWALLLSLQKSNLISPETPFVGLGNYRALVHDPLFRQSLGHMLIYTGLFVPISIVAALGVAVALNRSIWFIRLYRTAFFVPVVASTIATSIMFLWLFDKNFGLANFLLGKVGLGPFAFFDSPSNGALYSIVAVTVWGWIGFDVIIYLAALQGIPQELLEAAAIDGASRWSTFRSVVLPLLGPATLFLVVWSTINALQLFDEIYNTTRGGPLQSTTVVVYYLWQQAFQFFEAGYAAAIAYVLFLAILVVTVIQLVVSRRTVHYTS
jgi:multiple sugar transport system permease protein